MSTLHDVTARLVAWVQRHVLILVAGVVVLIFATMVFATTFRLYDERRARTDEIAGLARANCEGINETNATVRFVLDGSIRSRPAEAPPISAGARQLTIDTYRRLPQTDCTTGEKTYFDPPFPKENP